MYCIFGVKDPTFFQQKLKIVCDLNSGASYNQVSSGNKTKLSQIFYSISSASSNKAGIK